MEKRGFTLIELLIVIAIAVIISGALVPLFSVTKQDAKLAKAKSEIDAIRTAAIMCNHDTSLWPTTGNAGSGFITTGGLADWGGPYLDKWPNDPWGAAYSLWLVGGSTLYVGTSGKDAVYQDDTNPAPDPAIMITSQYP